MSFGICSKTRCSKPLSKHGNAAQCVICLKQFHLKCSSNAIPNTDLKDIANNIFEFYCSDCSEHMFPFNNIETIELLELLNENVFKDSIMLKKCKCGACKRSIKQNNPAARCSICTNFFHLKCEKLNKYDFPIPSSWCCALCILKNLPFSNLGDDIMTMTLHGMDDESISTLAEGAPSFSIKSILDDISYDTDQFISATITSKYYTIGDFASATFSNKKFKIFHLNIASLQKHIHELRTLLSCSKHNFDVICISETRLHEELPIVNVEIDGYEFIHIP